MAYKPPKQTIVDNDLKGVPSNEAVFEGLKLKLPKPSIDGTSGQLLARGASSDDTSWVNPPSSLPSSSAGDVDKVLAVDASGNKSWRYAGLGSGNFGNNNVILGREKPANLTGTENTIVGYQAGYFVADKTETVSLGWLATATGQGGVALGREATAGLVGTALGRYTEAGTESLAAGHNAKAGGNNATAVGPQSGGTGFYTTSIGYGAKTGSGYNNISIGYVAGYGLTNGADNIFLGPYAGISVTTGSNNTIIGNIAGTATLSNTIILAAGNTERIRHDATQCTIKTGDLAIETVGKTLKVATGTDAAMGLAVFSGVSTVTVTTAAATGNYYVFLTAQSGTDAFHIANKTTGSFDIVHGGNTTADVAWLIVRY
ncbi:hypothetical protein EBS40_04535 [bacterium]|nr:hypothetical protein [bacterium]